MAETIGEPTEIGKAWQRGYPLERLQRLTQQFRAHDGDRPLGAFTRIKENAVANWLAEGRLQEAPGALVAYRWLKTAQTVRDFRGEMAVEMPAGTLAVERVAGSADDLAEAISALAGTSPILWRGWADHRDEIGAARALGLHRVGTLIRASSEVLAIRARYAINAGFSLPPHDTVGIAPLLIAVEPALLEQIRLWPMLVEQRWVDHYSSYNKRQSWHAVALRSFGGDPAFIEKPAEMSRRYQQEHPERLGWPILDTPLMDALPGARDLISDLGCEVERVRLMRLTGGGELSRHADITDRAAGTSLGSIARLHLPIVTHESVRFTTWDLENWPQTVHMAPGWWWYLDVRKPHRAENPSGMDRIHLVVDCVVDETLSLLIGQAAG